MATAADTTRTAVSPTVTAMRRDRINENPIFPEIQKNDEHNLSLRSKAYYPLANQEDKHPKAQGAYYEG